MAAIGKKNKTKWKPVNADIIIDSSRKPLNWAEEVDKELDASIQYTHHDNNASGKFVLPTAPRASRSTAFDESKLPTTGPFQAYLSNIPYDLNEDELVTLFQDLKIKSVRLPKEEKTARAKGFGYIEFEDRASLCTALSLGDPTLKGRIIKIELATNVDSGGRGGNRGRRDGGRDQTSSDRMTGNWRTGPRQEEPEERGGFDRGGYGGGRKDFGSGGGGGFSRGFDREERSGGGGGFQREERFDRGREDRGRDDRGFRDRYDRDRGGGGGYGRDREGGFGGDRGGGFRDRGRDEDRFPRSDERDRGGQWREEPRGDRGSVGFGGGGGGRFEGRERDGKYGPPPRRDDLPAPDRESRTRQKLVLQPRTKPKEAAESASTSASIFGGAKPVDTAAREREIEERLMRNDEFPDSRSKSGPGSTGSRGDKSDKQQWEEKKVVEPAPPPKENAWSRKPQTIVNNGRSSPEDEVPQSSSRVSEERSRDVPKEKHADDEALSCPVSSGRVHSGLTDRPRGKDVDKPNNKHRERKESLDDISKMPKVPESKTPNFAGSNKFSTLVDSDDEAPTE
ncbi:eukaryotic translation initiation factor 4B isoform X2 [Halyomorpha halys]|uniref:eukaryotic translation initiation factor 4B isoform X2 n=1 Tax=Halyomorpha halys TaxID=286706 RepID=UPI0006D51919|nr:eukaryotic translation initiation factor 4B-like isoform X2 [Halyomorpha halys]